MTDRIDPDRIMESSYAALGDLLAERDHFKARAERAEAALAPLMSAVHIAVQELPLTLVGSRPNDQTDNPSRAGARLRLALREARKALAAVQEARQK